ncbi:Kae1-associated serine/threonine protein kinase [Candidatus Micrarchaeota archaeon]|nr:Kae1-associated serine/threonine protein kinase [Candidatus Micrarchaeota archaeon]
MRGAEAIIKKTKILGKSAIIKSRIQKTYRIGEIDRKLRMERTRVEARLLHRAKLAGVNCPVVFEVFGCAITMSEIDGSRPKMSKNECFEAGTILAKLHAVDIIHGDYTPANLLEQKDNLIVIDFGLGFVSKDVEDKAVDFYTMIRSIQGEQSKSAFADGYKKYKNCHTIFERVKKIEKRVRYAN